MFIACEAGLFLVSEKIKSIKITDAVDIRYKMYFELFSSGSNVGLSLTP